jgi:hypothetical protein
VNLLSVESMTLDSVSRILPLLLDLLQDPVLELPRDSRGRKCYATHEERSIFAAKEDASPLSFSDNLVLKRSATVAVEASWSLLKTFGDHVQTCRNSKHVLGVDLSRDERQQR